MNSIAKLSSGQRVRLDDGRQGTVHQVYVGAHGLETYVFVTIDGERECYSFPRHRVASAEVTS